MSYVYFCLHYSCLFLLKPSVAFHFTHLYFIVYKIYLGVLILSSQYNKLRSYTLCRSLCFITYCSPFCVTFLYPFLFIPPSFLFVLCFLFALFVVKKEKCPVMQKLVLTQTAATRASSPYSSIDSIVGSAMKYLRPFAEYILYDHEKIFGMNTVLQAKESRSTKLRM